MTGDVDSTSSRLPAGQSGGYPLPRPDQEDAAGTAEHLAVTGGGGGVGLHAIQLGRMLGARVMGIDLGETKQEAMRRAGAEITVDPQREDRAPSIREWTGRGLDGVLELVGPATMPITLEGLAKGGRMVIVGSHTGSEWTIDPGLIYRNEWEILGSRNVTVDELATVVELVEAAQVTPIIDQTRSLDGAEELQESVLSGAVIGRDVLLP